MADKQLREVNHCACLAQLAQVVEELKHANEQIAHLVKKIEQLGEQKKESVSDEEMLSSDQLIYWTHGMPLEDFKKAASGKDINHCYYSGYPLAFYLINEMSESWYREESFNNTKEYLKFMFSRGLSQTARFNGVSLMRHTDNALRTIRQVRANMPGMYGVTKHDIDHLEVKEERLITIRDMIRAHGGEM